MITNCSPSVAFQTKKYFSSPDFTKINPRNFGNLFAIIVENLMHPNANFRTKDYFVQKSIKIFHRL